LTKPAFTVKVRQFVNLMMLLIKFALALLSGLVMTALL